MELDISKRSTMYTSYKFQYVSYNSLSGRNIFYIPLSFCSENIALKIVCVIKHNFKK